MAGTPTPLDHPNPVCGPTTVDFVPQKCFSIHTIARGGRPEMVQYLTQLQPETAQWQDSCGHTPLHYTHEMDEERKKRQALALHELEFGGVVQAHLRRQGWGAITRVM
jgi:hypothetical protein